MKQGNDIVLKDEKGGWSTLTQADVFQSNGVIHVVDTVRDAELMGTWR